GSRFLRRPFKANVPAVSIFFDFLPIAAAKGYRLYFLGARPGVVDEAVKRVREQYPTIQIVGFHHGHYGPEEIENVVKDIQATRPQVIFVAMSTPQKEKFIDGNKERLGAAVLVGVGGTFDIVAGVTKLA